MRITWYGHACFRLEGSGIAIVTDPYTPGDAGLPPVPEPADVVVMSSALDAAHSCWQMIPGSPHVVNALDATVAPVEIEAGVVVYAVPASEGEDRPDDPKANALYTLTLDGIAVCHMGDVGTPCRTRSSIRCAAAPTCCSRSPAAGRRSRYPTSTASSRS
jgi:beta-lactamase family protein